jgi:uncharacterized membrane protein
MGNSGKSDRSSKRNEPTADQIVAEAQRRVEGRLGELDRDGTHSQPSSFARRVTDGVDRLVFWLTNHWLSVLNSLAFLYVGFPVLAPVLMKIGFERAGRIIHTIYGPLCHQLPYRSWYLFGAQLSYTQAELSQLVGDVGLIPHGYVGDPWMGYKVALCQRDIAIYGAIFLTGLFYALTRRRMRPMPFWAYITFGVLPMALDGGLQFLSYLIPVLLPSLTVPPLESNPIRRTITGVLFGLSTVWLAYPYVAEAFAETRETLERRIDR